MWIRFNDIGKTCLNMKHGISISTPEWSEMLNGMVFNVLFDSEDIRLIYDDKETAEYDHEQVLDVVTTLFTRKEDNENRTHPNQRP
jgi:hypothetical protein